jgi:nicotinate-nucleotide pyrophosphorylase (carboxylating)
MTDRTAADRVALDDLIRRALAEDVGSGDVTTAATVRSDVRGRGVLLAKASMVVAGLDVARAVFAQVAGAGQVAFTPSVIDGSRVGPGDVLATVEGPASALLTAERTALNLLQRLTGIATATRAYVDAAAGRITVLDTRKTTPTLRALEKYAVRAGGGANHRFGLFDLILIKDNHVRLAGGIAAAVAKARAASPGVPVEVEAQTVAEAAAAADAGADVVLLDNMSTPEIREAVRIIAGRAKTEVSGGVTLARIPELAATGADFVSVGALTHSVQAADISLEIEPVGGS